MAAFAAGLGIGCGSGKDRASPPSPRQAQPATRPADNPLYVPPSNFDFSSNPRLLARIRQGAHGYFRFINIPFSEWVCRRFDPQRVGLPLVNLHGDAHLEQYSVTSLGRGLTDYDDSSSGPGTIDLARMGTSIALLAEARGWRAQLDALLDEFFDGYRDALTTPALEPAEPAEARRIRAGFRRSRAAFLAWVESVMTPLSEERRARFDRAAADYIDAMVEQHPDLGRAYFRIKRVGTHPLGIGSALDEKYLVRIEGPSPKADDDVVVEAKEVRDLRGISCIRGADRLDPFRVLVGQARIAYQPYPYLGYARLFGKVFWIHGWSDNYHEMTLDEFRSLETTREILRDIGFQLGRGHVNQIASPLDAQLRRAQRVFLRDHRADLRAAIHELKGHTVDAWRKFKAESLSLSQSLDASGS